LCGLNPCAKSASLLPSLASILVAFYRATIEGKYASTSLAPAEVTPALLNRIPPGVLSLALVLGGGTGRRHGGPTDGCRNKGAG